MVIGTPSAFGASIIGIVVLRTHMANRARPESLSTTVTAIVRADRLGSNLASVLEELAEEVRNRRMIRGEEIANLIPTKMVVPMTRFMLPALFVMIFGGVVAGYLTHR